MLDRFKTPAPAIDAPVPGNLVSGGPGPDHESSVWAAAYNLLIVRACKDKMPALIVCDGPDGCLETSGPMVWLCARIYGHHAILTSFELSASSGVPSQERSLYGKQAFLNIYNKVPVTLLK